MSCSGEEEKVKQMKLRQQTYKTIPSDKGQEDKRLEMVLSLHVGDTFKKHRSVSPHLSVDEETRFPGREKDKHQKLSNKLLYDKTTQGNRG